MIECEAMRERMPGMASGTVEWTDADAAHLAACTDCALEWRVLKATAALPARPVLDVERIAAEVTRRLREAPAEPVVVRRLPWRGAVIGLLAAAASVALILSAPQLKRQSPDGVGGATALAILPELQGLDDSELELLLQSLGPTASDAAPGLVPHLEDLTDRELEQLLHSKGGE